MQAVQQACMCARRGEIYRMHEKWTGCMQDGERKDSRNPKKSRPTREGVCLLVRLEAAADLDSRPGPALLPRESVRSCTPMASFILDRNANL